MKLTERGEAVRDWLWLTFFWGVVVLSVYGVVALGHHFIKGAS